jgi:hypothetical protein
MPIIPELTHIFVGVLGPRLRRGSSLEQRRRLEVRFFTIILDSAAMPIISEFRIDACFRGPIIPELIFNA